MEERLGWACRALCKHSTSEVRTLVIAVDVDAALWAFMVRGTGGSAAGGVRLPPIRFRLPLPPSVNELYVTVRTGRRGPGRGGKTGTRRTLSVSAETFRRAALHQLDLVDGSEQFAATLALARSAYWSCVIDAYFETPLRRDLDGVLKITLDAIADGLRLADNRLVDLHVSKRIAPLDPHLDVELEAFADWPFEL